MFDLKALCEKEGIPLYVTSTYKKCKQVFGQYEDIFFYCPWYLLHRWVEFMANNDITVWHEVSQRPFQTWFKWIQRLTAPKVSLPPVLVRTKKKFESLREFVFYYLEQSKKSSY